MAFAGYDEAIGLGAEVRISGERSVLPVNAVVNYKWEIIERPNSSQLEISSTNELTTTLVPDVAGNYQFAFSIEDINSNEISTDTLSIYVSGNPVAIAGNDVQIVLGERPTLSGRESYDPENERLTYNWTIVEQPLESTAELRFPTSSRPILEPDVGGIYAIELIVSDGFSKSLPDTVLVEVGIRTAIHTVNKSKNNIKLFPNPASNLLNVKIEGIQQASPAMFTVLDLTGKILFSKSEILYNQRTYQLFLQDVQLSNGIYVLRISTPEYILQSPFIRFTPK